MPDDACSERARALYGKDQRGCLRRGRCPGEKEMRHLRGRSKQGTAQPGSRRPGAPQQYPAAWDSGIRSLRE